MLVAAGPLLAGEFIAGADFSHLTFFEDRGIVYKDSGTPRDALEILKDHGLNCVRLRLFTSSAAQAQADPYDFTNNLDYTLPLAVRVKNAGLEFMLDFHYSDTWADPSHQTKPGAWSGLDFDQLVQQMRGYNSNCIAAFAAAGAMPDYVQIGNEITGGLLWPDGQVGGGNDNATQWSQLGELMKAAVQGIHDAAGTNQPKIIVHIDRGGDWNSTRWFFDNLNQQSVPFDIIGESYYPWWHGDLDALQNCLTNAASRYDKPVIVAETAFPWGSSTNIIGIPASTNGQVQFVTQLANVVKGVPGGKGLGIVWWGTEYVRLFGYNLAGFDRRSFFNSTGSVLPVAGAFGELAAPAAINSRLDGANLILDWPLSGAGLALARSSNLADWETVTNDIQSTGTAFTVTLPLETGADSFYRLQSN